MGRVYRGEHLAMAKPVAIKVLHAALGRNQEAATRFQREAVASGRLDHPNIVNVSDFGTLDDGSLYLVMEVLEGEHLGKRLQREKQMLWDEALLVIRGVLLGLRHAHDRGVVHRDIKPDNIFLARKDGEEVVKVLDFGIAKLYAGYADDLAATRSGITVGTPAYLSPEQAVGGAITPACDVYSTSVVLYEMLVGCPPFDSDNPIELLTAHACSDVPSFRELAPKLEVPDGLEQLVHQGLAKIAAERISSALEYIQRIDDILLANGVETAALPTPSRTSQSMGIPVGPYASLTPAPGKLGRAPSHSGPARSPTALATTMPAAVAVAPQVGPKGSEKRHATTQPVRRPRRVSKKWLALGAVAVAAVVAGSVALLRHQPQEATKPPAAPPPVAASRAPQPVPRPAADNRENRYQAELHTLLQGTTCSDRKAAIPKLVALGDSNAIPALRKARNRGAVNACLRVAADDAIKTLGKKLGPK